MVRVVDGARSSITPESSPKPEVVTVPKLSAKQLINTLIYTIDTGDSNLVNIDGDYYEFTRKG